jgi:hypothetical protein
MQHEALSVQENSNPFSLPIYDRIRHLMIDEIFGKTEAATGIPQSSS